jgi:hypothetical protein
MTLVTESSFGRVQQPGKPKPPGNPPREPDHDGIPAVEEPREPIPLPPPENDEPPMEARP